MFTKNFPAALALGALVAGCNTTPVAQDFRYSADMPNALVIMAMFDPTASTTLNVMPVDPATCRDRLMRMGTGYSVGFGHTWRGVDRLERRMIELPPGSYVIRTAQYSTQAPILRLEEATLGFTVEAGDVINVGEMAFVEDSIGYIGNTEVRLDAFLAQYPGVTVRPEQIEPVMTTFTTSGGDDRIEGCAFPRP